MITLALELSSRHGSLALLSAAEVVSERTWDETSHQSSLFKALPALFEQAGMTPEAVDLYAVGRGPGSYSGLRMAITTAQAMALPGKKPVVAVSSGEALARAVFATAPANLVPQQVVVVGDARRHSLWLGVFERRDGLLVRARDWGIVGLDEAAEFIPEGAVVVSPDALRLAPVLAGGKLGTRWPAEDAFPLAPQVAWLALEKMRRGEPSEPLTPAYMHPPVFILPRYPDEAKA